MFSLVSVSFALSADGKKILVAVGETLAIVDAGSRTKKWRRRCGPRACVFRLIPGPSGGRYSQTSGGPSETFSTTLPCMVSTGNAMRETLWSHDRRCGDQVGCQLPDRGA